MSDSRHYSGRWIASPYLHLSAGSLYNPHTGRGIPAEDPVYPGMRQFILSGEPVENLDPTQRRLADEGWLIRENEDLSHAYRIRWVSLEAHSVCNQRCFFCPVSVAPRETYFMDTDLYERIITEIAGLGQPIEAVAMIQYNEPTVDRRFVDQVRAIKDAGLPPAVLSNGSGLTPDKVDALVEMGGITYFSVNLSTLDPERYAKDRGRNHLERVLANLDYARDKAMADEMVIVVLGTDEEQHARDFEAITKRFADSNFKVQDFEANDRAGYLDIGLAAEGRDLKVRGCDYGGSRPIEHVHITAAANIVLCCQDYDESWVLGNLKNERLKDVLDGEAYAQARRQVYGIEAPPEDFICDNCRYALRR
jgi:MoaA/NifB/PqqE/SkfB family radical SAM enzyme